MKKINFGLISFVGPILIWAIHHYLFFSYITVYVTVRTYSIIFFVCVVISFIFHKSKIDVYLGILGILASLFLWFSTLTPFFG